MEKTMKNSLVVISAIAKDKPKLVYSVTKVLKDLNINIVDIDARAVRGYFLLFLIVDLKTSEYDFQEMYNRLEEVRLHFDMGIRIWPYNAGRRKGDKGLMIATLMGADRPGIVAEVAEIFSKQDINVEKVKMIARGDYIAMEIAIDISDARDKNLVKKLLYDFAGKTGLDIALQDNKVYKKHKRVVIFDCDSTVIQGEIIEELAKVAGVKNAIKEMTDQAMNGKVDFTESIKKRVKLLKGISKEHLALVIKTISLTPGAEELISALHSMGYKVGVISGGFTFFTDYLKERLKLDYVFANELEIKDGFTTGKIKGDIIDAEKKGEIVKQIAKLENISQDEIVAIGDGANDRFMLKNSGVAVAFNPKEILKEYSNGMISSDNILGLLHFMGIPNSELKEVKNKKEN
jgi:phosphoserine phosphatase